MRTTVIFMTKKYLSLVVASALSMLPVATFASSTPDPNDDELIGLGPGSVPADLMELEEIRKSDSPSWPSMPTFENIDLKLGADISFLSQRVNNNMGEDVATGGVVRFYGTWKPASKAGNENKLVFKVEYRDALSNLPPNALLFSAGAAGVSAPGYNDRGAVLSNLYWGQQLFNNKFSYIAGIIDVSDYFDVYALVDPWTDFNNLAFSTNPSSPTPSQGLGIAGRWLFDSNVYVLGSLADINGNPHRPEDAFDSFFNTAEYFKHIEVGIIGSWNDRVNRNVHITLWQADERKELGIDEDHGVAFSWNTEWNDWQPFIRGGYAKNGTATLKKTMSIGFGKKVHANGDVFGVGLNWGNAAFSDKDQYTTEIYYKWNALKHILIVPGVQYVYKPVNNSEQDHLWLVAVKARVNF